MGFRHLTQNGLEKLADPEGFTGYIIDQYFNYLPLSHLLWTYLAAYTQIVASILVVLGLLFRPALLSLMFTMIFAVTFHFMDSGLQGAPFAIVDAHNYEYETSSLYLIVYLSLMITGPGQFSLSSFISKLIPPSLRWLA